MRVLASEIPLRILIDDPPESVTFRVQRGKTDWENPDFLAPARETGEQIAFEFDVRLAPRSAGKPPNFLGPFAQGPAGGRFVYVNSGTLAGQKDSCWSRRAKIPLTGITWKQIDELLKRPGSRLEARFTGTGRDGGPACASVPLIDGGWRIAQASRR
jgi:hypothetical protein